MENTITKTLIEKSIFLNGIGRPDLKTIFTIEKEEDKKDPLYKSLDKVCGRNLRIDFKYSIGNNIELLDFVKVRIPVNLTEDAVKAFILEAINNKLNS